MTDFFDDLERELRRAHRRDTERPARSRVFVRRRLPGLPAAGLRTLVALAVVVAFVAVVVTVGRESDVERPATPPPPSPTTAPGAQDGCLPSKWWNAPIVDEPIPQAIASRFAIFRDPPPSGQLPRDTGRFLQAKKLYRGALTLRPRLDTGARLRVVMIAADITSAEGDHDRCAPPPDPTVPGICVAASGPNDAREGMCFSIDAIENAEGWFSMARTTAEPPYWGPQRRPVVGLAPDGVDGVTFDTATGTKSLNISGNVFAGEIRSTDKPFYTDARFAP